MPSIIDPKVIDCIIIATTTPDNTFPSTATKVQNFFQLKDIPSFDIQAVCSGFIYGLQIADSFIKSEKFKNILLIGAETLSKIVDWKDRRTCVLFGDGAGSMILSADKKKNGILIIDINGPKSENFYKKKDFFSLKNKKEFLNILKKNNFEIINHGEVYKSYLNIKDHEFLAIAKK